MPSIVIEDIPTPSFNKIEQEGDYQVTVTKALLKAGNAKPHFVLTLENEEGETIYTEVYLTKESKWRLQEVLFSLGIVSRGAVGTKVDLTADAFLDAQANIEVKRESWIDKASKEEKSKLKVSKWWALGDDKPEYGDKKSAAPTAAAKPAAKPAAKSDDSEISL